MRAANVIPMVLALTLAASAQAPPSPPLQDPRAEEASLHGYGDSDKTCQEWTDSCRTCQRSDGAEPVCSNVGIACQPKAITCVRRAEEKK